MEAIYEALGWQAGMRDNPAERRRQMTAIEMITADLAEVDRLTVPGGREIGQVVRINGHVRAEVTDYIRGHAHAVRVGHTDDYLWIDGRWTAVELTA